MMAEVREQKPYDAPALPWAKQCVALSVLDVVQALEIPESIFRTSAVPPTQPEGVPEEDWAKLCEEIAFTEAEYGVLFPASTDREAIAAAFQHPLALNLLGYLYPLPEAYEIYLTEEYGRTLGFHNLVAAVRGIDEEHRPELLPQKETMLKTLREEAQIDKIFSLPNLVGKEAMMGSIVNQTIWLSDHLILQQQRKLVESELEELVLYDFVADKVLKRFSEIPSGWITKWENGFSIQVMNPDPESPRESLYFDLQLNPSTKEAVGEKDEKERRTVDGYSLVYGGENEYKEVLLQAPDGSRKKLFDTGFQEDQYWNFTALLFAQGNFLPFCGMQNGYYDVAEQKLHLLDIPGGFTTVGIYEGHLYANATFGEGMSPPSVWQISRVNLQNHQLEVLPLPENTNSEFNWSGDGRYLTINTRGIEEEIEVLVYDMKSFSQVLTLSFPPELADQYPSVMITPDGKWASALVDYDCSFDEVQTGASRGTLLYRWNLEELGYHS